MADDPRHEDAERLLANLSPLWDDTERRFVVVLASLTVGRAAVRQAIAAYQRSVAALQKGIAEHGAEFARDGVLRQYVKGWQDGLSVRAPDVKTAEKMAVDTYEDFLANSVQAGRTSDKFARIVRRLSAQEIPRAMSGGDRTAIQAGRALQKDLEEQYGAFTVRYANGAEHSIQEWAQMAARTHSAEAYNTGNLASHKDAGVEYVEVFDGSGCGWTTHDDPDKAAGTVRSLDDAQAHVLSHPRCRRSFAARLDVTTDAEAKTAKSLVAPESRADQIESEKEQAATTARRRTGSVTKARQRQARWEARAARAAGRPGRGASAEARAEEQFTTAAERLRKEAGA